MFERSKATRSGDVRENDQEMDTWSDSVQVQRGGKTADHGVKV